MRVRARCPTGAVGLGTGATGEGAKGGGGGWRRTGGGLHVVGLRGLGAGGAGKRETGGRAVMGEVTVRRRRARGQPSPSTKEAPREGQLAAQQDP